MWCLTLVLTANPTLVPCCRVSYQHCHQHESSGRTDDNKAANHDNSTANVPPFNIEVNHPSLSLNVNRTMQRTVSVTPSRFHEQQSQSESNQTDESIG
ncbi:hypothetical protein F2P81_013446 [Scophthalmus maximus]|uniref:Secreted protein n=1 Tax=Scophthalmus maximus TaxID=52904 RepID=A0A6A4SN83_SCOMX|nr:hypothetical protein F2P81_013446 [Scophthalmus maximus]